MWNDTYMTENSEHNCSVNNEKKCSQWLQCTILSHFLFFFLTSALLLPSKHLSTLAAKAPTDLKCWCYMLLFYSFYSLEDVQFQFRWNICSLGMVGQCVSGGTKMRPIKACQGTEGRVKWCANALLSLQWHYKWLPVGMLITQDRKRGRVESLGCCMNCGRRNGR